MMTINNCDSQVFYMARNLFTSTGYYMCDDACHV